MSIFGRLAAGAGSGMSEIASKHIDEQLAEQRAQVLADIQQRSHMKTLTETDAFVNDPERRARDRGYAAEDLISKAGATDTAALNTASNKPLMDAAIARTNELNRGTMDSAAEAAGAKERAIAMNKPVNTPPGDKVWMPDGTTRENTRLTGAEASLASWREQLHGKKGEDRDRAYEAMTKSISERMRDNQKDMDKLLADNPDAMTPPKPAKEGTFFGIGSAPAENKPAFQNYQRLMRERALLSAKQDEIVNAWRGERAGGGGGGGTRAGGDPLNLFSGDIRTDAEKAKDAGMMGRGQADRMAELQQEYANASPADRPALEREIRRAQAQGGAAPPAAAPVAPAVNPAVAAAKAKMAAPGYVPPAAATADFAKPGIMAAVGSPKAAEAAILAEMEKMPGEPREEVNGQPNPQHAAWQRTYGARFDELRRQLEALRAGTAQAFDQRLQRFKEQEARGGR